MPCIYKITNLVNGKVYNRSFTEAEQYTGVDRHIIKRYIEGKRKDEKYHFKIVGNEVAI